MAQLDSRWGEETAAVWSFLELAYRKGLLDEVFRLSNTFMDPNINPMDLMGDVEEKLSTFDFDSLDTTLQGQLVPIMKTLTDDEVVEGLTMVLQMVKPLAELAIANFGGDVGEAARKARMVGKSFKTLAMVATPFLLQKAMPILQLILAGVKEQQ
jgi:hypothetical protein